MKTLIYFATLIFTVPGLLLATLFLTISHVQHGRNILITVYEFLMRITWGIPIAVITLVALLAVGWLDHFRIWGAGLLCLLNLVALFILFAAPSSSRSGSGLLFLSIPVLAFATSLWLVLARDANSSLS